MTRALLQQALDALSLPCDRWSKQQTLIVNAAIEALRTELDEFPKGRMKHYTPEPMPVAYLAWRDGKPCFEGDDCVCENAVYPVDSDDDRTSMPVYTKDQL